MTGVDLETLRLLAAIGDLGSINAAATRLGISQPAGSARLREFEARWQISVAVRTPRGTRLTPEGDAVVGWARKVLREVEAMESGLRAMTAAQRGDLAVAASLTIAEFLLPRWMSGLKVAAPGVRPHLQVVNSEAVLELLASGAVALGFIEDAERPQGLSQAVIGYDSIVVVVEPSHPWARRSYPIPREQLLEESYVLREPGSGTRSTFERALRAVPEVALEASSTQTLVGAALAGVGPAVLSALAVKSYLERGELVAVRTELDLRRPLRAVWPRGQRLTGPARELLRIATSASGVDSTTALRQRRD
ncbi:LysR family transcriptional regulator [Nocardioides sp. Bht2]|uniref:LysR family transcriptional regulator n=1 Tax=Nocardioides sp. Bht2 TaxID=3392297 RepID=UPI0039B5ACBC